jgi:1,4-dihydroxy-2-naphthoyl-CoA synthase
MPIVIVQRRGAVLEIVLNRPAVLNAANREMIGELAAAAAEAAEDAASRVILLRGAGSGQSLPLTAQIRCSVRGSQGIEVRSSAPRFTS